MYRELATINKVIDLSPRSALDSAETFLTQHGYSPLSRTDTSLTVKRDHRSRPPDQGLLALTIKALPQPEGGVQVKIRGNDEEGLRERQAEWREWVESLPNSRSSRSEEVLTDEALTKTAPLHETEGEDPIDEDPEQERPNVPRELGGAEEPPRQAPTSQKTEVVQTPIEEPTDEAGTQVQAPVEELTDEPGSHNERFEVSEVSIGPPTSVAHSVAHLYEYKMVQLPPPLPPPLAAQEEDQEADKAVRYLQAVANEQAEEGWEFYRVDALGDRGGQRQYFVATFRRPR